MLLVGLDADLIAGVAIVDPAPLSAQGEMIAQLLGLRTYSLRWLPERLELNLRSQWAITHSPAPRPDCPGPRLAYDVVAEHRCHMHDLPGVPSVHDQRRSADADEPPF